MLENFETIRFSSAREFLSAVRRSDPRWLRNDDLLTPWVYRGQSNSEWKLTPSAWRPSIQSDVHFRATLSTITDKEVSDVIEQNATLFAAAPPDRERVRRHVAQRRFEFLQVQAFTSLADDLGMDVPGGLLSHKISRDLVPHESLFAHPHPAYALAQHHGMATRLLDWTQNPLYAAFFGAENPDDVEGAVAVWALNATALLNTEWIEYRVPRSKIGFLHSQAGLFTYHQSADAHCVLGGDWPELEQICGPGTLKKLVLPSSEAKELRRLLFAEGVSKAHLMPTFDNIRNTLRAIWEERFD